MENCKELCEFQVRRNSVRLSRNLLVLLEDMQTQHKIREAQLLKDLPPEYHGYVKFINPFTEEHMKFLRKRVLDNTNDHVRDLLSELENYRIEFNFKGDSK